MLDSPLSIRTIDSHTGGEPTRVILEGAIPVEGTTMLERRDDFRDRFDHLRTGLLQEPRGSEVLVGAVLTSPVSPDSLAGIIFCNNVGYLGMCGHGTIGVVETLRHLGRIAPGHYNFDTPAGTVRAELREGGEVAIENVFSYRSRMDVRFLIEGAGEIVGDVAYGGNWFFVVKEPVFEISLERREELTSVCRQIHEGLLGHGIFGIEGAEIDHIELAGHPSGSAANSRNFVMCPGGAYDRSPCGTGTSAKMACLFAAGKLSEGEIYVQQSVTGSIFRGTVRPVPGGVIPTIVGSAHIVADTVQHFSSQDPLKWGLSS